MLTFFYAVPMINRKNLRMIGGIKIFVVAGVWAGVTVLMSLFNERFYFDRTIGWTFFQRILIAVVFVMITNLSRFFHRFL